MVKRKESRDSKKGDNILKSKCRAYVTKPESTRGSFDVVILPRRGFPGNKMMAKTNLGKF